MTYADTTINALAGIAYAYAVELNEAAIHADHDELENLARQITGKLKAKLRVALEEHQAAAPATQAAHAAQREPDWDDVISQAETATGLPVERHTFSIVQREIRRWLAAQRPDALQAEIAGHEAANLHLSALVDELRELLQDAKRAMTELHLAAIPDESTEGVPAIIPPEAFRKFVDAHAMLCFCLHQRGHNPPKEAGR